jgi:hypothetical protein
MRRPVSALAARRRSCRQCNRVRVLILVCCGFGVSHISWFLFSRFQADSCLVSIILFAQVDSSPPSMTSSRGPSRFRRRPRSKCACFARSPQCTGATRRSSLGGRTRRPRARSGSISTPTSCARRARPVCIARPEPPRCRARRAFFVRRARIARLAPLAFSVHPARRLPGRWYARRAPFTVRRARRRPCRSPARSGMIRVETRSSCCFAIYS